jgi:hypothetical protein
MTNKKGEAGKSPSCTGLGDFRRFASGASEDRRYCCQCNINYSEDRRYCCQCNINYLAAPSAIIRTRT